MQRTLGETDCSEEISRKNNIETFKEKILLQTQK